MVEQPARGLDGVQRPVLVVAGPHAGGRAVRPRHALVVEVDLPATQVRPLVHAGEERETEIVYEILVFRNFENKRFIANCGQNIS